jgi:hypothetical protein
MGIVVTPGVQYDIVDIALDDSSDDEMLQLVGRSISVLSRTGTLEIRLNHLRNPLFSLDDVENLSAEDDFFQAIYFTNTAQAGKAVKLLITRLAGVEARRALGDVNLDTIGGTTQAGMDLAAVLADLDIAKIGGTAQTGADLTPYIALPSAIVDGTKSGITTTAAQLCAASTPLLKGGLIKVRSLGTGSYIAVGNATSQNFRMDAVKDTIAIDFIDNCNKIYVKTDAGNTGVVEFIGG